MSHFIVEINTASTAPAHPGYDVDEIAKIIQAAGGRLVDSTIKSQVLILIVEAKSELIVIDLLEASAFSIEQIRHIFLLETCNREDRQGAAATPDFTGFFGGKSLHNTVAIEVYPC